MSRKGIKALGIGIEAIFDAASTTIDSNEGQKEIQYINRGLISPCRYQPRKKFDQEKIQELANSITEHGFLQPILVRETDSGYEIIAGERRWRASAICLLDKIPCIVCPVSDSDAMVYALIENVQRENLNPIEEAKALKAIADQKKLTHIQLCTIVGKSRSHLTNLLRLLNLCPKVMGMLCNNEIEMGHGRALLALPQDNQFIAAEHIVERHMTVREAERYVQRLVSPEKFLDSAESRPEFLDIAETYLRARLGKKVKIKHLKNAKLNVSITVDSLEEIKKIFGEV